MAKIELANVKNVKLKDIKPNPNNPRLIRDEKFEKLVNSIKEFPEMLAIRPIVVNADMITLGGNMRLKACEAAGLKEVPIIKAEHLTDEQQRQFIIKDNVGFGEWDWEMIANEWDENELDEWGLDLPLDLNEDKEYTSNIEAPIYEPSENEPNINELFNDEKTKELIDEIKNSEIDEDVKQFLTKAAQRHCVFDYQNIADFYAHASKEVQNLMEKSALIIIDFDKAIEYGYVELTEKIKSAFTDEQQEQ